jgi:hypothetical protein
MSLSSIVLTSLARAYYLGGVSHDSGLVETLSKCVSNEGAWRCMVVADAPMDVLQ